MPRQDLDFPTPWSNAAGMLGFAPSAAWPLALPQGVFVTNPLSRRPRAPAAERSLTAYPGGLMLHTGLPNPGFRAVLRAYARRWAQAGRPVWVHLLPAGPAETAEMVRELENLENIAALELGLEPDGDEVSALELLSAGLGELPLVAALPLSAAQQPWLRRLPELGVSGITLGAPRGMLATRAGIQSGRLYGPALFPQALAALRALLPLGLPVVVGSGVYSASDARACLAAGAAAVQFDLPLWKGLLPEESLYSSR